MIKVNYIKKGGLILTVCMGNFINIALKLSVLLIYWCRVINLLICHKLPQIILST